MVSCKKVALMIIRQLAMASIHLQMLGAVPRSLVSSLRMTREMSLTTPLYIGPQVAAYQISTPYRHNYTNTTEHLKTLDILK